MMLQTILKTIWAQAQNEEKMMRATLFLNLLTKQRRLDLILMIQNHTKILMRMSKSLNM